jgi:RNA 2',3'-cyclic 3'-phosphodiesterase
VNSEETEGLRLFVAVTLPAAVNEAVMKAQDTLRRAAPENQVRWSRRDQLHLTLRFLGDVEAERLSALTEALQHCGQQFAPLHLRAEDIGFFPDARRPHVVWVGVQEAQDQLRRLQAAVQAATAPFTTEKPEQHFTGHVTFGRFKGLRRPDADAIVTLAKQAAQRPFGQWVANEIEIIQSELSPKGAQYTTLAELALTGSGPGGG